MEMICVAEEWQRDGRGLWAMRSCISHAGHDSAHTFTPWNYDVKPRERELLVCLRRMCGMYGAYSRRLAHLLAEDEGRVWTFEFANSLALKAIADAERKQ
jgi:hypothetical protein